MQASPHQIILRPAHHVTGRALRAHTLHGPKGACELGEKGNVPDTLSSSQLVPGTSYLPFQAPNALPWYLDGQRLPSQISGTSLFLTVLTI